jgi:hypothetical protein
LKVFRAGMKEQVDVRVDKAGKKCGVTEVNDFGAGRARDFRADFNYGVARDKNFAGGGDMPGFDIEKARGVKDDCVRACGSLGLR